jgi:hypothetical protein
MKTPNRKSLAEVVVLVFSFYEAAHKKLNIENIYLKYIIYVEQFKFEY